MQETKAGSIPRLDWFDYARLACASWVMLYHYTVIGLDPRIGHGVTGYGIVTEIARFGPLGVHVFLMISGLVITLVAQHQSAATFVTHRVVRIYPTFLACMTITALLSQLGPDYLRVSFPQYLANLPIGALVFGYRFADAVYWSLLIELIFYGAMLVAIMTGAIRRLQLVVTGWVALMVLCAALPWRLPLVGIDYAFIAAGAVMALLYQRRNDPLNYALLAVTLLLCLRTAVFYATAAKFDPWIAMGITVAVFALFLAMRGRHVALPFARRIGSMTYALYLIHFKIGIVALYLTVGEANKWWVLAGLSVAMIVAAFLIDDVVEFRMRPYWMWLVRATVAKPFAWLERRSRR